MTPTQVSVLLFPRDFLFRQDTNFLLFAIIRHPVCMFLPWKGNYSLDLGTTTGYFLVHISGVF